MDAILLIRKSNYNLYQLLYLLIVQKKNVKGYCLTKNGNRVDNYKMRENGSNQKNVGSGQNMGGLNENNICVINTGNQNDEDEQEIRYDNNRINID